MQAATVVPHQQSTLGSLPHPTGCSNRPARLQYCAACRRQGLVISCDGYMLFVDHAGNLDTELAVRDCHGGVLLQLLHLSQFLQVHKLTMTGAGMSLFRADSCIYQCVFLLSSAVLPVSAGTRVVSAALKIWGCLASNSGDSIFVGSGDFIVCIAWPRLSCASSSLPSSCVLAQGHPLLKPCISAAVVHVLDAGAAWQSWGQQVTCTALLSM